MVAVELDDPRIAGQVHQIDLHPIQTYLVPRIVEILKSPRNRVTDLIEIHEIDRVIAAARPAMMAMRESVYAGESKVFPMIRRIFESTGAAIVVNLRRAIRCIPVSGNHFNLTPINIHCHQKVYRNC